MKLIYLPLVAVLLSACGGGGGYAPTEGVFAAHTTTQPPVTVAVTAPVQNVTFTKTGTGANVFDIPTDVTRIRIQATYNGLSSVLDSAKFS